jgi:hypothetical protein
MAVDKEGTLAKPLFFVVFALFFLALCTGWVSDEDRQREIREKADAGEFEEAKRLAIEYFAADKLLLMVSLEYIAGQKEKALKNVYHHNFLIIDCDRREDENGRMVVNITVLNSGDKTVTGFAVRIDCVKNGKMINWGIFAKTEEIGPGTYKTFEQAKSGHKDCDELSVHLIDFAVRD